LVLFILFANWTIPEHAQSWFVLFLQTISFWHHPALSSADLGLYVLSFQTLHLFHPFEFVRPYVTLMCDSSQQPWLPFQTPKWFYQFYLIQLSPLLLCGFSSFSSIALRNSTEMPSCCVLSFFSSSTILACVVSSAIVTS